VAQHGLGGIAADDHGRDGANMVWDGLFHAATLILTLIGVLMLWSDGVAGVSPRHISVLIGQMIWGWGLFNLVEGVIDHHLLNIHHVRDMPLHVPTYDWVFLAVGCVGFSLIGLRLARGTRELPPPRA
jgi:uncharacterized membrane protein